MTNLSQIVFLTQIALIFRYRKLSALKGKRELFIY